MNTQALIYERNFENTLLMALKSAIISLKMAHIRRYVRDPRYSEK